MQQNYLAGGRVLSASACSLVRGGEVLWQMRAPKTVLQKQTEQIDQDSEWEGDTGSTLTCKLQ